MLQRRSRRGAREALIEQQCILRACRSPVPGPRSTLGLTGSTLRDPEQDIRDRVLGPGEGDEVAVGDALGRQQRDSPRL